MAQAMAQAKAQAMAMAMAQAMTMTMMMLMVMVMMMMTMIQGCAEIQNFSSSVSTREEKRDISKRPCNVLFIISTIMKCLTISFLNSFLLIRSGFLCSHSNGDLFTSEKNMLFSHVKISCFRTKAHLVFHLCLYNKNLYYIPLVLLLVLALRRQSKFPKLQNLFIGFSTSFKRF